MKNKALWIPLVIFIALEALFAFTDLAISQSVANPQSGWANFLEAYGQLPGALVGFLGSSVLLRLLKLEKTFKSIAAAVGLFILTTFLGLGFWADALGQQSGGEVNYILALVLSVLMLIVFQALLRRFSDNAMEEYRAVGKIAVWLFFLAGLITVWGIKIPWGRWTYRDILEAGDLSLFTPWYLPQGNNGHHSFISGHTAISFCVLPVVLLFRKNKNTYTVAWIIALAWGVLGAASRVAIGAHFPSDVLFGAGQALLWFWILKQIFINNELEPKLE